MSFFVNHDWMLASGLSLKGLSLSLFAITASYNSKGCMMYESIESLALYLGYSDRQVGKALRSLVSAGLLTFNYVDGRREFRINVLLIKKILEKKRSDDNHMADSFNAYLESWPPVKGEEQSSFPKVKKVPAEREQSSPNNIYDNIFYNISYNVLDTLSSADFIDLLFPIFFFKNNCSPVQEIDTFVKFYKDRKWKLGRGKTMTTEEELMKAAESWTVRQTRETGFHAFFMNGWKEVYKIVPEHLKKDALCVKTLNQSQLCARIKCSEKLTQWLNEEKELVEALFTAKRDNYKLEW